MLGDLLYEQVGPRIERALLLAVDASPTCATPDRALSAPRSPVNTIGAPRTEHQQLETQAEIRQLEPINQPGMLQ